MKSSNNEQTNHSLKHFAKRIQSGVIAGLIMLIITTFILFLLPLLIPAPDGTAEGMGFGMLMLCFMPFWLAAHGILGVSLYIRSGNIASPTDGALIGAASSIFLVIISMGFGILSDTLLYNPNSLIRGAAFGMGLAGAGTAAILSALVGMIWASTRKNSGGNSNTQRDT